MLAEQADPSAPGEGDRVRLSYDDGGTVTGRWEFIGGGVNAFGLLADDGRVHTDVTSGVRREVIERAERPRLALLSRDEALVVARLLARRLADRGLRPARQLSKHPPEELLATITGVGHEHRPRPSGNASFKPPAAPLPLVDNQEHAGVRRHSARTPSVDVRQETGCPTYRRRGGSSSSTQLPIRAAKFNGFTCEPTARQSIRTPSWPRRTSPTAQRSAQRAPSSCPRLARR